MSRPSRIQLRRFSSRRRPVASVTAVARPLASPGGSRTTRSVSARRARAARRLSRSATFAGVVPAFGRGGRSTTRTSTDRAPRSIPPMDSPSSSVSGVRTTSQSRRTPRAAASTGSRARARSSQATIAPSTCASAIKRRASVVAPDDGAPCIATLALRGRPPGPTMASSAGKPVRTTRSTPVRSSPGEAGTSSDGSGGGSTGNGAVASAPITRGAAAPHRVSRDARAADTSGERLAIGRPD
jgi:hypothetical protein